MEIYCSRQAKHRPAYEICDKGSSRERDETEKKRVFKLLLGCPGEYQWHLGGGGEVVHFDNASSLSPRINDENKAATRRTTMTTTTNHHTRFLWPKTSPRPDHQKRNFYHFLSTFSSSSSSLPYTLSNLVCIPVKRRRDVQPLLLGLLISRALFSTRAPPPRRRHVCVCVP